jgi:hypothetical protein
VPPSFNYQVRTSRMLFITLQGPSPRNRLHPPSLAPPDFWLLAAIPELPCPLYIPCLSTQMHPDCDYSLSGSYIQGTVVSYRAQRPSHLWHILTLIIPIIICIIIDLISILAPMPMPYYIFPSPSQNLKTQKRRRIVCACVSPPPPLPSTALLRCTALCALGRGPVCEGVAAGWRASQTTRRTAFAPRACSPNWTRALLC